MIINILSTYNVLLCAEELEELRKKEKEAGYTPDWELDAFMKAEIRKGKKESIVTDLVIKLLGLDVSPSTLLYVGWLCSHLTPQSVVLTSSHS